MKTAISIPDRVFRSAEQLAQRLGVSRSELYARALAALVDDLQDDLITSRLNEIYAPGQEASSLDAAFALLQHRTLARGKRQCAAARSGGVLCLSPPGLALACGGRC